MTTTATPVESYVGFDTIPQQIERKLLSKGFNFNLMVVGKSGLGKTTFINTLFASKILPPKQGLRLEQLSRKTVEIETHSHLIQENGVNLSLTVTDTPGFGDAINNEGCWEPITKFIKEQYSVYLRKELTPNRERRIQDSRIHCVLYFISPSGHSLSPLDIAALKRISEIVNVVPVIGKSDTLTLEERAVFKKRIKEELKYHNITIYPLIEDMTRQKDNAFGGEPLSSAELVEKQLSFQYLDMAPFAIVGSDRNVVIDGKSVKGRQTRWGLLNVENEQHCEFVQLRNFLIRTHLQSLIEVTAETHYESFRTRQLLALKGTSAAPGS